MDLFDPLTAAQRANADGEFCLAARLWDATVELVVGDHAYLMRLDRGRITEFAPLQATHWALSCDLRISAPLHDWQELLKPIPRPFYQDLMAAMVRHQFRVEGDVLSFYPYYRAINRLFELMREARA